MEKPNEAERQRQFVLILCTCCVVYTGRPQCNDLSICCVTIIKPILRSASM